ncbi:MAG: hypothetical protein IT257_00605 [Chitinophagaceae bacterium]|nr:hypothetical protein [Chitinophagaceae bacterium]
MKMLKEILSVQGFKANVVTYIALLIGISLLFVSLQLYLDTYALMNNRQMKNDQFEYLVLNKNITNKMMGDNAAAYFTKAEIEELRAQKAVKDIGLIESNQFPIEASNFGDLAFSTQLFFESIPDDFLDIQTENFFWKSGNKTIPVILSQDFLNLYNFGFALSQGLPQMSEETVKAISFNIQIANEENYTAEVVGFSQRYSSVIVPVEFMRYANAKFGNVKSYDYARLVIQTEEADQPELVKFIRGKNYSTQNEKIKWSKIKTVMGIVFASSGLIGLFILALCMMLLVLYLNLVITRAGGRLQLLSLLGYKTATLQRQFTAGILTAFVLIVLLALMVTVIFKFALSSFLLNYQIVTSKMIAWQIVVLGLFILALIFILFRIKSKKIIQQYLA